MQARRARSIEREPAEQDDARLRAGPEDDAGAREARRKALAQEARQQPPNEPMFEVELHDAFGVDAVLARRGPERDRAQRRVGAPVLQPLAALAPADSGDRRAPPASRRRRRRDRRDRA